MAEENLRYKKIEKNIISPLEAILSIGIAEAVGRGGYQGQEKYYEDKDKKEADREKLRERRRETLLSLMPKLGNDDSSTAQHLADMNLFMKRLEGQPELQQTMMNGYTASPKGMGNFIKYIRSYEASNNTKVSPQDLKDYFIFATVGADNPDVNPADVLKNVIDPTLDLADAQTFGNLREDISTLGNTSGGAFAFEVDPSLMKKPNNETINQQKNYLQEKVYDLARKRMRSNDFDVANELDANIEQALRGDKSVGYSYLKQIFGVTAVEEIMKSENDFFNNAIEFNPFFQELWEFKDANTGIILTPTNNQIKEARNLLREKPSGYKSRLKELEEAYGPGTLYRYFGVGINNI